VLYFSFPGFATEQTKHKSMRSLKFPFVNASTTLKYVTFDVSFFFNCHLFRGNPVTKRNDNEKKRENSKHQYYFIFCVCVHKFLMDN
jgi:hypothetical protein